MDYFLALTLNQIWYMLAMTVDHTMNYQRPTFLFLLKLIPPSAIWIETTSWKESSSENGSDATSAFLSSELVLGVQWVRSDCIGRNEKI